MKFYTPESTSLVILLVGALTIFMAGLDLLVLLATVGVTAFALLYLMRLREEVPTGTQATLIGLLPGHYLLLLGLVMTGGVRIYVIPWLLLVLATLGYDFAVNYWPREGEGKLTKITLYCIIWGVILFLFQGLLIGGLDLSKSVKMIVWTGLSIAGVIWVAIGVVRINSGFSQRRS